MINTKQIIKKIGSDKLSLVKCDCYWLFVYDDRTGDKDIFETKSVYVMYLNQLTLQEWIVEGLWFVKSVIINNIN